jgi:hypothetical protein
MKKLILFVLVIMISGLFADLMQPTEFKQALTEKKGVELQRNPNRDTVFMGDPIDLLTTYYDYMPGSYNDLPIKFQTVNPAEPGGWAGGGIYMVYHASESPTAQRRIYYSYIDADGNVITQGTPVNSTIVREGYAGLDIDPATGDPLVAWHSNVSGDAILENVFTYDLYDWIGGPGLWVNPPWEVISTEGDYIPAPGSDEFIWPYVNIVPLENGNRRVFITTNNATASTGASANPSENVVLAQADFDTALLGTQAGLEWSYSTIPEFDDWHNEDPEWYRPNKTFVSSDNGQYVAYVGYRINDSAAQLPEDKFFVLLNDNYGEGDFTYYSQNAQFPVDNPMNEPGTEYTFETDAGEPYNLYFSFVNSGHFNAIFADDDSRIMFPGAFGLQGSNPSDETDNVYWPYAIYPKVFSFDMDTHEFTFCDLDIQGANPCDSSPMLPWDLDEDGEVDEFYDDGTVSWYSGWPISHPSTDDAFHDNNFKIVKNEEAGYYAVLWQDGLKAKYAEDGVEGYEEWLEVPEIAISVMQDGGGNWSETVFLNANETPELEGMIPAYVYPGDLLEDMGNGHAKMHLLFLDDNSFGSSLYGHGEANGGTMKYGVLDINMIDPTNPSDAEDDLDLAALNIMQNYPNPFNPVTTISFDIPGEAAEDAEITVYNIKGREIKKFDIQRNQTSVVWNGTDESGNAVSSGVYFYKLTAENKYSSTKKMILMK